MILKPLSRNELLDQLRAANATGQKITRITLGALNRLVAHVPEDMTATVEGGMTVAELQRQLHLAGQWLPIDPENSEKLTVSDLLGYDRFGPRRLGYGRIRDYLIGVKVALADGTEIKAGGQVVKNVAGYDLCKLFIGARHTLGMIVEATFKLRPLPERESIVQLEVEGWEDVEVLRKKFLEMPVEPVLLDAHNLEGKNRVIAGFAGAFEDVAAQVARAKQLGFGEAENQRYAPRFAQSGDGMGNGTRPREISVLPSRLLSTLREAEPSEWIAHLGFGFLRYTGGRVVTVTPTRHEYLEERLKDAYDPKRILEEIDECTA